MTDFERGYEQGKADAAKKMHPEIRKCLEDYFDKCFSNYREGLETYREGILVGPCFCGKWPGGVPPIRHWAGLEQSDMPEGENPMFDHQYFLAGMAFAAKVLEEKNT